MNRVMYGRLNALMTFPSTYKDLMEDALSHMKWEERGTQEKKKKEKRHSKIARRRLNERKRRSGREDI